MCTARGGGDRAKFSQPPIGATSAEGGAAHATRKDLHCVSGQWTGWSERGPLSRRPLCFAFRHRHAAVSFSIPSRESARPSLESLLGSASPGMVLSFWEHLGTLETRHAAVQSFESFARNGNLKEIPLSSDETHVVLPQHCARL
jgi:hypothetical protein